MLSSQRSLKWLSVNKKFQTKIQKMYLIRKFYLPKTFLLKLSIMNFLENLFQCLMNKLTQRQQIYQINPAKYKKVKQFMNSTQSPSRLRLITLLIPPSNDPLLTPYKKQINPKIMPLKRNYSILSNIRESPKVKQQKLQLSKNDFEKINRSYQSLKRFKKTYSKQSENEEDIQSDPQYLNLVQMRKSILIRKNAAENSKLFHLKTTFQMEEKQSSFLRITQPIDRLKFNHSSKNKSPVNKQKLSYLVKQKSKLISSTLNNAFLGQKQSPQSSRYFHRR